MNRDQNTRVNISNFLPIMIITLLNTCFIQYSFQYYKITFTSHLLSPEVLHPSETQQKFNFYSECCVEVNKLFVSLSVCMKWSKGEAFPLIFSKKPAFFKNDAVYFISWTLAIVSHPLLWWCLSLTRNTK